jgi:TIR domain
MTELNGSPIEPKAAATQPIIDLFICHNGADKGWVEKLAEQVESETFEGTPNGRPLRVFFDKWDIRPGANVIQRLNDGLAKARYVGVVVSPDMVAADWPTLEWTHVIADDPTNRRGRLLPLFLRDGTEKGGTRIDLPAPFRVLNWIDFRSLPSFKPSYLKLIAQVRDLAPTRGRKLAPLAALARGQMPVIAPKESAAPDRISEVILGNLIPALSIPMTVWSAPTACREEADVRASVWPKPPPESLVDTITGHRPEPVPKLPPPPGFTLADKRLYTFTDLGSPGNRFAKAVDLTRVTSHPVHSWRSDPVRWNLYVTLLNKCLKQHCCGLHLRRDLKGRYFFLPARDGGKRRHSGWYGGDSVESSQAVLCSDSGPQLRLEGKRARGSEPLTFCLEEPAR